MKVNRAAAFGLLGFLLGFIAAFLINASASLGTRASGAFTVIVGVLLILVPYVILVEKLTPSGLTNANATIGIFALRASNYLIVGGFVVVLLGLINLLKLLPWL